MLASSCSAAAPTWIPTSAPSASRSEQRLALTSGTGGAAGDKSPGRGGGEQLARPDSFGLDRGDTPGAISPTSPPAQAGGGGAVRMSAARPQLPAGLG